MHRLRRLVAFLEEPDQRVVVYLREAAGSAALELEDVAAGFGDDVASALALLVRQAGDAEADLVLRAAQNPLAREVLANDIGEELDRLDAPDAASSVNPERRDVLIMGQALLDRVAQGSGDAEEPSPVRLEVGGRDVTVYTHPVHGDVVVLVRTPEGHEGPREEWVLIDKAQKDDLLLRLVAERVSEPLKGGLVAWLRARNIPHHYYEGGGPGDPNLALG